ncbi:hypothetical protein Tco_0653093 [Tanacetum coccineum]|uniref:Uncharacterized protein n=1 Tax=Tanacetum coccineum TaxID=301880 RepID=A0ABQ4WZH2_9ASTR
MAIKKYDHGDTLKNLIINNYKFLKMEKEINEDMEEEEEEDMNINEDMGIYEGVKESMLEHEDKKIHDEMEIDEGVEVMHKTVGPFRIHHNILKIGDCQLLETWFKNGDHSMTLVCVKYAERFAVSKGEFWKTLSPNKHMSNTLINHVTEVLNIRQILNGDVKRWYFPTDGRDFRIYSARSQAKSRVKYYIKKEDLSSVKQIFFPVKDHHLAMSSDNASSTVTYTSISSDSNGLSWGIPLVNAGELPEMDPYEEVVQQG